jgi:HKD family nuclease
MGDANMQFFIQDPTFENSYSLHEALIQASKGAEYGAGAYAFVTAGGARLLLEDDTFTNLFSKSGFQLIIGMDDITSEKAVNKLMEFKSGYSGKLEVNAFLHDTKGSLFHPKFSWFKHEKGGVVVLGSGNLTENGLRRNREAFNIVEVDQTKIEEIEAYWKDWLSHSESYLRDLEEEAVLEKAKLNTRISRMLKKRIKLNALDGDPEEQETQEQQPLVEQQEQEQANPQSIEEEDRKAWDYTDNDTVYLREIPGGTNDRWNQANFDKYSFINFFGAQIGNDSQRILLRNVQSNGTLADIEVRKNVSVASHNYRFELKAASGVPYPKNGRPIGVFVRVASRMFIYVLAIPTDGFYNEIRQFLDDKVRAVIGNRMKTYHTTVRDLKSACSHLPLWNILT